MAILGDSDLTLDTELLAVADTLLSMRTQYVAQQTLEPDSSPTLLTQFVQKR